MTTKTEKLISRGLTTASIIWVLVCFGNLGIVPYWLYELTTAPQIGPLLPEIVIYISIFIFFVGLAQVFFIALQNVLTREDL